MRRDVCCLLLFANGREGHRRHLPFERDIGATLPVHFTAPDASTNINESREVRRFLMRRDVCCLLLFANGREGHRRHLPFERDIGATLPVHFTAPDASPYPKIRMSSMIEIITLILRTSMAFQCHEMQDSTVSDGIRGCRVQVCRIPLHAGRFVQSNIPNKWQ